MVDRRALLGTWKMVSWQREIQATGERVDALGPDPVGYISYAPDGRFFAIVVRKDRPVPATLPPTDEDKLLLFGSKLAYAGTYTVDEEKAVHHVDASWNQAWTGTDLVRFYKLEGDDLTISGAPARDPHTGQEVVYRIAFRRVPPRAEMLTRAGRAFPAGGCGRKGHRTCVPEPSWIALPRCLAWACSSAAAALSP